MGARPQRSRAVPAKCLTCDEPCVARDVLSESIEVPMLTTTGVLLIGCVATVFGAMLEGSAAAAQQTPDALLLLGATVAFSLARRRTRS